MLLIIGFLLIFLFGYLLSIILVEKMLLLERLGISYLIGLGVLTLIMFCYSTLGIRITLGSTLIVLTTLILITYVIIRLLRRNLQVKSLRIAKVFSGLSIIEKVIVLALAGLFIGSLIISLYYPVYIWDALAIYDFRGKVIAQEGFYTQIAGNYFWFAGYPLFTSLSHTLVYLFDGKNPQILYSLMYISFIFIFYSKIREFVSRRVALISAFLLSTTPVIFNHSTFAYTNLPYTIFLTLGSIYLYNWFAKEISYGHLILAAVLTGLSTWTRSTEPFWAVNLVLPFLLVLYNFKKYIKPLVTFTILVFLIKLPWSYVNYYILSSPSASKAPLIVSEVNSYAKSLFGIRLVWDKTFEILVFIYENVITSWYPLLFLFLLSLILNVKKLFKQKQSVFLLIIITYFGLLIYATYVYSLSVPYWKTIPDSARRMAMFFMPLMIYYIGLILGRLTNEKE